jgi:uncharacterized protein with von Willebrand factor type A (vWA) domain
MARPPQNLREQIQSQIVHGFILGILSPFTSSDFEYFISKNINLIEAFANTFDFQNNAQSLAVLDIIRKNKNRIDEYLNYDAIMEQMMDHRPDLVKVFSTEAGKRYLNRLIEDIRSILSQIIN